MVGRFAELWLVQAYRDYDFDMAVEQLTILWANALGLKESPRTGATPKPARKKAAKSGRASSAKKKSG